MGRLAYGPADATAITVSCFSKIQTGFTFLVPAYPGVCVYVLTDKQRVSYQLTSSRISEATLCCL